MNKKIFVLALTMLSALSAKAQVVSYDPRALEICRSGDYGSQIDACLLRIKNKKYDLSIIDICKNQDYFSQKVKCLGEIENKKFVSHVEVENCRSKPYASAVLACLGNATTVSLIEPPAPAPSCPVPKQTVSVDQLKALRLQATQALVKLTTQNISGGSQDLLLLINNLQALEIEASK